MLPLLQCIFPEKESKTMGVSTYYFIGGLTDPTVHYELGGSIYFSNNACEPNYHLDSIIMRGDTLEMNFTPDSGLPAALRTAQPNYMRFYPHKTLDIRVIVSLFEGDRTIQFVYFYDCIDRDGKLYFRKRTISRMVQGPANSHIGISSEYDKLIEEGFSHCTTQDSSFSDLRL